MGYAVWCVRSPTSRIYSEKLASSHEITIKGRDSVIPYENVNDVEGTSKIIKLTWTFVKTASRYSLRSRHWKIRSCIENQHRGVTYQSVAPNFVTPQYFASSSPAMRRCSPLRMRSDPTEGDPMNPPRASRASSGKAVWSMMRIDPLSRRICRQIR